MKNKFKFNLDTLKDSGKVSVFSIKFNKSNDENFMKNLKTNPENIEKDLSADPDGDIISNFIGHYGKWHFMWTFVLSLFQLPVTFHIFAYVFQSANKDFWCARPDNLTDIISVNLWKNLTQPKGPCLILQFPQNVELSTEYLYKFTQDSTRNETLTSCTKFEYEQNEMGKTLIEEFDLVCDRQHLVSVVEMCFLAGAAIGSVSSGWISDKFGRKNTLMIFATVQCIMGTLLAVSTSLPMFMALRTINGFASMTVTVVSFVLVVELVSGKWRTVIGILNILPVALTYTFASGIAYLTQDWRLLQLVISTPWFVMLLIWYCVPESPRWLLATGKINKLAKIVERAAKMNGIILPGNYLKTLEAACPKPNQIAESTSSSPVKVVLSRKYLKTTLLTLLTWFTMITLYFGLTLHLSNLGGNIYLNTAIAGLVEAVSVCLSIFVVIKLGIRQNLIAYMAVAGIACLLVNAMPSGQLWPVITLALIGKCAMGATNAIIPTFTAQQYPTVVRNFGVGVGNLAAGIALICVPYMWLLEHYHIYLPMTVMGICGVIGSVGLFFMKDKGYEE